MPPSQSTEKRGSWQRRRERGVGVVCRSGLSGWLSGSFMFSVGRGFLTQPLEQIVSGYWPLLHWNLAVHIAWEVRSSSKLLHKKLFTLHSSDVRGNVCDGKCQMTFDSEQQCAVWLLLSLIAHNHVIRLSMGVDCDVLTVLIDNSLKLWKSLAEQFQSGNKWPASAP